ncbi:MAG: hypothetical protein M1831_006335 [Alyxoria varia]|nr:MAG: hypothetical protein M1831_006335 [Alyxoria varia]
MDGMMNVSVLEQENANQRPEPAKGSEGPLDLSPVIAKPEPTFLGIPLEIREKIYKHRIACDGSYVLDNETMYDLEFSPHYAARPWQKVKERVSPYNLLTTNRQVHEEVRQTFWPQFWFRFDTPYRAEKFLHNLSAHQQQQIRRLVLGLSPRVPLHAPRVAPADVDPKTLPRLIEIRSSLPNLKSILFELEEVSRCQEVFRGFIPNFVDEMMIFRDVEDMAVTNTELNPQYTSFGTISTTVTESGIWRVAKAQPDGTSSSRDATPGKSPEARQCHSFGALADAVESAYLECQHFGDGNDSGASRY